MLTEVVILVAMVALLAVLLYLARRRYPPTLDPVVDAIDALLPQTQCAQCGYPGCRPYAQAVAAGAALNLCPPGGRDVQLELAALLGREEGQALVEPDRVVARIDEDRCIGCYLCIEACPVDAIVGARQFLHTVLEDRCTGCGLCLPPCPVDCIELLTRPAPALPAMPDDSTDCIRCNRCLPVCPEGLPVSRLWWLARGEDLSKAMEYGLGQCIECGLCNPVCPSVLDLVGTFRAARARRKQQEQQQHAATLARRHVEERNTRLTRQSQSAAERRAERLAAMRRPEPASRSGD